MFNNGHRQAILNSAELRLDADKVALIDNEPGDLVILPLHGSRGQALMAALAEVDRDIVTTLAADRTEGAFPRQERDPM